MDLFESLVVRLANALYPLGLALESERGAQDAVAQLGWVLPAVPPSLLALGQGLNQLNASLGDFSSAVQSAELGEADGSSVQPALDKLLLDLAATVLELHGLPDRLRVELPPDYVAATHIDQQLEGRIFDWLVSTEIADSAPLLYCLLRVAGIIEVGDVPFDRTRHRPDFTQHRIRWERLLRIVDPVSLAREVYGWGTTAIDTERLFAELVPLSFAISMAAEIRYASAQFAARTTPQAGTDISPSPQLWIPVYRADDLTLFAIATALPKAAADELQGIALGLVPSANAEVSVALGDQWKLTVEGSAQVGTGVTFILRPDRAASVVFDMEGSTGSEMTSGQISAGVTWTAADWQSVSGASAPSGTRLTARSVSLGFGAEAAANGIDVFAQIKVDDGALMVAPAGGDGFLASILPTGGLNVPFSLALRWSRDGVHFQGAAGLAVTIPLNLAAGPLQLQLLDVGIQATDSGLGAQAVVTASLELGPVTCSVAQVGFAADITAGQGNLGPLNLDFHFRPPSGVGLVVDAAGVTGGGFLAHDDAKHEYSGALQLQFINLALQAFGLITTQVAGGAGYSLLALVDAEFPPVQLGWGFTLDGVGGLLAVHRTASTDALHAALKAGQLSSILFPKSAITNAPVILGQLDTLFPTAPGRFLFGPMALIGWGTPRMLKASIAVVIELPEPVKVILLSRIELRVPDETSPVVRVNMDALGILDLGKDELSFDAVLFDSKLVDFTMSGAMTLRAEWGSPDHSEFVLAIGGVHPQFTPPPNFPQLQRVAIDMPSPPVSKLRLAAYLAVTSNTIQLGANLDFLLGVSEFNVSGHLGFDALLHRDPFRFTSDISGKVAITAGGDDIASVDLEGTFSGPKPYHLTGQFTVHIVFFDVGISFDYSWGGDLLALLAPAVDVLDMLRTAVADLHNWDALLPPGVSPLVTARQIDDTSILPAHPLGRPEVRERIVPLGLAITRFGESVPSGATTFTFTAMHMGTGTIPHDTIQDDFAPAQFFELTDEEKLERPSFERHDAGMRVSAAPVTSGAPVPKTAAYETFFVDTPGATPREDSGVPSAPPALIDWQIVLQFGSAGRAAGRSAGRRYQAPGHPIRMAQPAFVLADRITMAPAGIGPAAGGTFSDMHALLSGNPTLQILATHEMTAN